MDTGLVMAPLVKDSMGILTCNLSKDPWVAGTELVLPCGSVICSWEAPVS